jgi:formate hydrogenlyase transcriptional activator
MASHPGERKRHFPEELPVAWDPIRRALEEDEDWYRDLVEHSQDLLCVHDLEGRFLSVNPVPARLLGYSVEEVMQKPMRDFVDPQFRAQFDVYLREIARTGEARGLLAVVTRSGEQRIWEYHNTLRTEGVARPIVRGMAHDVTDQVRAQKALRTSNDQLLKTAEERERTIQELTLFRTLLDQSNDAIKVIDPETLRFLDVNEKACMELGYSREELLSMTVPDIDPDADESLLARVRQELQEAGFVIMETVHRRKDGTTFAVEVNMRRVRLDREYCVSISRDITDRKRAEERLREFERVVEHLEEMIVVMDRQYRYVIANRAFLRYRRLTKEQVVGQLAANLLNPGVFEATIREKLDECFRGKIVDYELRYRYPELGERDLSITYLPVEGPKGIDRVACVIRDVTEQNLAEAALRESEMRFRAVYERSPVGIALVDSRSGRFLQVNLKFCEIAGRSEEELLRTDVGSITHPDDIGPTRENLQQLAEEKVAHYEMDKRYLRPDESVRWVRVLAVPMWSKGEQQRWHMGLVEDVTERKRAEEALRQSDERFRVALKNSPIAVFNQDRDLRYTWMYNSQHPLSESEKLGKTPADLLDPEEAARIVEVRRRVLETGVGERHEVQIEFNGRRQYLSTTIEPVFDSVGAVIGLTGASMDVTELREASEALREAKKRLTEEKIYLEQEIDTELGFGEIIGHSKALQAVMENVRKVASSDATVLLLGETGTGKELVAREIHRQSRRSNNSFIKLNCAAIPSGLLESELFGNEKGAFTGAVSRKIGRLELADKGTLFLDEIGEISLALQPKLLRVLQDQEFEGLGGTHTLKVDFRSIAATNRDLAEVVRQNEFRSDLYYRLNVFPIRIPPLRERRDDIRLLVEHFVQKCMLRMNKSITSIPKTTMDALMGWEWPGNVRELENFIERSVILTQGSVLVAPLSELRPIATQNEIADESLAAKEREHILRALQESHGQIGGLRGAAMRLGLKRTTLQSKLKHLGINPRSAHP